MSTTKDESTPSNDDGNADESRELYTFGRRQRAEALGDVARSLREVVRARGLDLRDLFKAVVEDAADRGWLHTNHDGFVEAVVPGAPRMPQWEDVPEGTANASEERMRRLAEYRVAHQRDHDETMADPDRLSLRVADNHEAKALNHLLAIPAVQSAALRALGNELVEPPALDNMNAASLARDLGLVGCIDVDGGVPAAVFARVKDIAGRLRHVSSATWEAALISEVQRVACSTEAPRARVASVLRGVAWLASEVPAQFREPKAEHTEAATKYMRTLRHGALKKGTSSLRPVVSGEAGRARRAGDREAAAA